MTDETKSCLESEGYNHLREIPGKGVCGIRQFLFTYGLVTGLDDSGYMGRYCYNSEVEALYALDKWDGTSDPIGKWIKYKGAGGERSNPELLPPCNCLQHVCMDDNGVPKICREKYEERRSGN